MLVQAVKDCAVCISTAGHDLMQTEVTVVLKRVNQYIVNTIHFGLNVYVSPGDVYTSVDVKSSFEKKA